MNYLRNSISNGSELEQALIRRWWHEEHESRGRIVWEYYLDWWYADAILFYNEKTKAVEGAAGEATPDAGENSEGAGEAETPSGE